MSIDRFTNGRVGAHVTTAGGLGKAIEKAAEIGAQTIQVFGSSPRSWTRRVITDDEAEKFRDLCRQELTGRVYVHACYLINFGTKNPDNLDKSIHSLTSDLMLANKIGARGVVVHPGSVRDGSTISDIAANIRRALDMVPDAKLIIENSAGGGSSKPGTITEIAELVYKIDSHRVEVCLDTAHLWGFGIDISTPEANAQLEREISNVFGKIFIPIVHFNDSKASLGSLLDRHENIGEGQISSVGLASFASLEVFKDCDFVLEVPGQNRTGPDAWNIQKLKEILLGR